MRLVDQDRTDLDPFLVPSMLDLNAGNVQIAHDISLVLRPSDIERRVARWTLILDTRLWPFDTAEPYGA